MPGLLDVTDLVEFQQRRESPSGVQRVIAELAPRLMASEGLQPVILDRGRGAFIALDAAERESLLIHPRERDATAAAAKDAIARARAAEPVRIETGSLAVFLGAVWIADALMLAARDLHARGAQLVFLLYDLTPVLEAGHTAGVNRLFDRYLELLLDCAATVPAISRSSRADLERYAADRGRVAPPGSATGLPCGVTPDRVSQDDASARPWPRPYALMVGTIESRKNHLLALEAWRRLVERHGDAVPDLVCVGRLGWHSDAFLREYIATKGLGGKVSILTNSIPDDELAALYSNAAFTVYPSRYEGWGLPISESLAFGKVTITARNSSLVEAGGELASYVATDDVDDLVAVIERDALDPARRSELEQRIAREFRDIMWDDVAATIAHDIQAARAQEAEPVFPTIELGREVMLATPGAAPDPGHADRYLRHLQGEGLTPMLRQSRRDDDFRIADPALTGQFGSPQAWGLELRPGRSATLRITRPVDGALVALLATRSMPGIARIEAVGPGGPVHEETYLGSVITLPLGDGKAGEHAMTTLTVTDASDSVEGFLGLRSFVVLRAEDKEAQVIAHKAAADALRAELDFIQGTRSWKLTQPLRTWKGRGAS